MAQTAALANIEADLEVLDRRLAKAVLVFNELLTILDLPDRGDHFEGRLLEKMKKCFEERGWSGGPMADPSVDELVKLLLKASKELSEGSFDLSVETVIEVEDKANKCFSSIEYPNRT